MSAKEVPRAGLLKAVLDGRITNAQGATALRMSVRQFQRVKKRFREHGAHGLLHRLRGRPGNRHLAPETRAQITTLMTTIYAGFNDVHLTEKLREVHALPVSRASVRRRRVALGQPAKRRRRAPKHRSRRPREAAAGQLVQLDASPFAWFEDRGPAATLHGLIDDATSEPLALWFRPTEDLHGYVTVLDRACRTHGLPVTLYGDRLTLFQRNDPHWTLAEQLRGAQDPTHFGRMLQALGIGFIQAGSPQAKGRIERLWGTLQDRLTSELRLRGLSTLEAGNAFLPEFLADFAPRFVHPPTDPASVWRPAPGDLEELAEVDATAGVRTPARAGRNLDPARAEGHGVVAGDGPPVAAAQEPIDGRLLVSYQGTLLATQPSPGADFVLTPRQAPSAERRPLRRVALHHALGELQRAQLTKGRALAPTRAEREGPGGARRRDRQGGRDVDTPRQAPNPASRGASPRWRPAPEHPWRQAFSRRRLAFETAQKG